MPRTEGSKNKPKDLLELTDDMESEDILLTELIKAKTFWVKRAKEMKDKGHDVSKELQYAEFFKLGINQFTIIDKPV